MDDTGERLRFGVNLGRLGRVGPPGSGPAERPVDAARWAEAAGFDVVTTADHFGGTSPFVMLAAAAAVTARVRLRTYVLDVGFWNPGLLARDVATLDVLSGGRVEVGLGAGHKPGEHEAVGPRSRPSGSASRAWRSSPRAAPAPRRPAVPARPVQRPVPLHVGAMSAAALEVAAGVGDLVALAGGMQLKGAEPGTLTIASATGTDARVAVVQRARASRGLAPPPARRPAAAGRPRPHGRRRRRGVGGESAGAIRAADIVDSPFLLAATSAEEAAAELLRRRDRWGITSWCTHAPSGPALADVAAAVRGPEG